MWLEQAICFDGDYSWDTLLHDTEVMKAQPAKLNIRGNWVSYLVAWCSKNWQACTSRHAYNDVVNSKCCINWGCQFHF